MMYDKYYIFGDLVINPALGCHYFPPDPHLPSQLKSIPASWPLPSYTAGLRSHDDVNNLSKVVVQQCPTGS